MLAIDGVSYRSDVNLYLFPACKPADQLPVVLSGLGFSESIPKKAVSPSIPIFFKEGVVHGIFKSETHSCPRSITLASNRYEL
jgi:hypothetical protein